MKKEIKGFDKFMERSLVVLTIISFIITIMIDTNVIYNTTYDTMALNDIVTSTPFTILLWVDNLLIYLFGLLYAIDVIKSKNKRVVRLGFVLFSVLSTVVIQTFMLNWVASIFKIF